MPIPHPYWSRFGYSADFKDFGVQPPEEKDEPMPHKYRVGQIVRFTSKANNTFREGRIDAIFEHDCYRFVDDLDGRVWVANESELTPIDDKPTPRFKKGDRVKAVPSVRVDLLDRGVGIVMEHEWWEDPNRNYNRWGYMLSPEGTQDKRYRYSEHELEPAEPEKPVKLTSLLNDPRTQKWIAKWNERFLQQMAADHRNDAMRYAVYGEHQLNAPPQQQRQPTLDATESPTRTRSFIRTRKERIMSALKALFLGAFCMGSLGAGAHLYFVEHLIVPAIGCAGVGPLALLVGFIGAWVKHRRAHYRLRVYCPNCSHDGNMWTSIQRGKPACGHEAVCPNCGVRGWLHGNAGTIFSSKPKES